MGRAASVWSIFVAGAECGSEVFNETGLELTGVVCETDGMLI